MTAPVAAPKVAEPVTKAAAATLVVNLVVTFLVGRLAEWGFDLDATGTAMLILGVGVVVNFLLAGLLWGLGRLSELVPWRTVRDRVTPMPLLDPDYQSLHHETPQSVTGMAAQPLKG